MRLEEWLKKRHRFHEGVRTLYCYRLYHSWLAASLQLTIWTQNLHVISMHGTLMDGWKLHTRMYIPFMYVSQLPAWYACLSELYDHKTWLLEQTWLTVRLHSQEALQVKFRPVKFALFTSRITSSTVWMTAFCAPRTPSVVSGTKKQSTS